jgi:Spy/CpxP family protein refolding chaperone
MTTSILVSTLRTLAAPSILAALLVSASFTSTCYAEGAADAAPAAGATPGAGDNGGDRRRGGQDRFMQRLIQENPELKDVDPNTPEGQDKIRAAMQARMEAQAPQMRERMAQQQAEQHAQLKTSFAMSDEDFSAIEPLLVRVENLRLQKGLVDRSGGAMGGRGRGGAGGGFFDPAMMMGDTPLEASVQETQDAVKALKALLQDEQASPDELTAAVVRLRKAREAFQAVLTTAQDDLRSVLTPRQEAILVDRGTLD